VLGGEPGERSTKLLRRADGTEEVLPAKCDEVIVAPGDMLVYRTAGGGGWKDRLDRPVEAVARDVAFGLVSRDKALRAYGVVLRDDGTVDDDATAAERDRQRAERGPAKDFDFGPPLEETLAACEAETGLPAPSPARPLRWAPLEDGESAMARARAAAGDGGAAVPAG
jgi:N-methylhydantoinase B